jgi:hypothetical protein
MKIKCQDQMSSIVNHHNSNKFIIITFCALDNDFGMLMPSITNLFGFCFANNRWLHIRIGSQILTFENHLRYCLGRICYRVFFEDYIFGMVKLQ